MITYPDSGYNSFLSLNAAGAYFNTRLHSEKFTAAGQPDQEAALITAFRSIGELDVTIDPTDSIQLQAVKDAQCEQALHELRADIDLRAMFKITDTMIKQDEIPRYSQRAIAILRPYMKAPVIQVVR